MTEGVKVSVIIPVYNAEKYLCECLDSVVNQTLREIEIICVDDGSTDHSLAILREYEARDSRVKVLTQENQYAGVARNNGMSVASGKYYIFWDADDFFELDALALMYARCEEYRADICICGAMNYSVASKKNRPADWMLRTPNAAEPFNRETAEDIYAITSPAPWNKLVSAAFVEKWELKFQALPRVNDAYFILSSLALADRIVTVNKPLIHYRVGQTTNLQSGIDRSPTAICEALLAVREKLEETGRWNEVEWSFLNCALENVRHNLDHAWKGRRDLLTALGQHYWCKIGFSQHDSGYFKESKLYERVYSEVRKMLPSVPVCKKPDSSGFDKNSPKVSVIIPVYNAEKYLRQCLDSVVNQTLREIEIICVDDGSTDNSLAILREYEAQDERVKVLTQENQGAAVARNAGLDIAKGKYLSILDADDFFRNIMLEKAYKRLETTGADVAVFRVDLYNDISKTYERCRWSIKDEYLPRKDTFPVTAIAPYVFQCFNGWAWDKLFRRDLIEKKHLRFQNTKIFNDAFFTFVAITEAKLITAMEDAMAIKRVGVEVSISNTKTKNWREFGKVIQALGDYLAISDKEERYKQSYLNYALHLPLFVFDGIEMTAREVMLGFLKKEYFPKYEFESYGEGYYYNRQEYNIFSRLKSRVGGAFMLPEEEIAIPIAYATDENYVRYTATSIESALRSRQRRDLYEFYILIPDELSERSKNVLQEIVGSFPPAKIIFVEMHGSFANAHLEIEHITVPTYYRLLLPHILPNAEKCIYLDGDTIICEDLAKLYCYDIQQVYFAGVQSFSYYQKKEYHRKRLGFAEFGEYINAGVLLMNLELMRENGLVDIFMSLLDREFASQDQDILNVACHDKIGILPYRYNVMAGHERLSREFLKNYISLIELDDARENPAIIHYATKAKPWNKLDVLKAEKWWESVLSGGTWVLYAADKTELLISLLFSKREGRRTNRGSLSEERYYQECCDIRASWSYRIGRFITWPYRMARGFYRCYQEHGWRYTWRRVLVKLHITKY